MTVMIEEAMENVGKVISYKTGMLYIDSADYAGGAAADPQHFRFHIESKKPVSFHSKSGVKAVLSMLLKQGWQMGFGDNYLLEEQSTPREQWVLHYPYETVATESIPDPE